MMRKEKTTIALLSADMLFERTLALLLEGLGYEVKVLEAWPTANFEEFLESVDLVLLAPRLSKERRKELLGAMGSRTKRRTLPVLRLSAVEEMPIDKADDSAVPWPSEIEALQREIEATLEVVVDDAPATPSDAEEPPVATGDLDPGYLPRLDQSYLEGPVPLSALVHLASESGCSQKLGE